MCATERLEHPSVGHLCACLCAESTIPPPRALPPLLSGLKGSGSIYGGEPWLPWGSGWSEVITITSGDLIVSWHYDVAGPAFWVPAWASPSRPGGRHSPGVCDSSPLHPYKGDRHGNNPRGRGGWGQTWDRWVTLPWATLLVA